MSVPEQGILLNHVAYANLNPITSPVFTPALKAESQRITLEATTAGTAQVEEFDDDAQFRDRTGQLAIAANDPTYIEFFDVFPMRLIFTPLAQPGDVYAEANSFAKGA
jgi:hypothetical protein